jgi:hypothetical protein
MNIKKNNLLNKYYKTIYYNGFNMRIVKDQMESIDLSTYTCTLMIQGWYGLWYLAQFSTIFQLFRVVSFISNYTGSFLLMCTR